MLILREFIERYSNMGEIVVDFFSGTFSTALAAFISGRKAVCFEKVCRASINLVTTGVLAPFSPGILLTALRQDGDCAAAAMRHVLSRVLLLEGEEDVSVGESSACRHVKRRVLLEAGEEDESDAEGTELSAEQLSDLRCVPTSAVDSLAYAKVCS